MERLPIRWGIGVHAEDGLPLLYHDLQLLLGVEYVLFGPVLHAKLFCDKEKLLFKLFFDLTCSNQFFLSVLKGAIR